MNGPKDVAAYIGPICSEMRKLALSADLTFLAYLLEMSMLEASKVEGPPAARETARRPQTGRKAELV
jgi:hypothetical protein